MLEQKELDKNIELVNVQEDEEKENTIEVVRNISKELNLDPNNIKKAWRVGARKDQDRDGKNRPIIVMLRSREDRAAWIQGRKQRLTNQDIYKNDNKSPVYINENITRQVRQLFWQTKTKLKEKYKYIWIQNAKVLIKKDNTNKKNYSNTFGKRY